MNLLILTLQSSLRYDPSGIKEVSRIGSGNWESVINLCLDDKHIEEDRQAFHTSNPNISYVSLPIKGVLEMDMDRVQLFNRAFTDAKKPLWVQPSTPQ